MKRIISFITAAILSIVSTGLLALPSHAEEETEELPISLQLSPTAITVTLRSNAVINNDSDDIECMEKTSAGCLAKVTNTGTESFTYHLYTTPWVPQDNGNADFSEEAANSFTQIARWITFLTSDGSYKSEAYYTIAPGETQTIIYRINVPEDVPSGSQYAAIWAQTSSSNANDSGIRTNAQAGMIVSGRSIGDTRRTAEVLDYDFTRFSFGGSLAAQATIKNTGNTDFDAYYTYTARTLFGKELYNYSGAISSFPESEHTVSVDWENTPFLGIFQVEFRVSAADSIVDEKHIVVIMPVFVMILLILLLTVIIVWIIIIIRKRKERKARTLV